MRALDLIANLRIDNPDRFNPRSTPRALGLPFCFALEDDPMTVSSASLLTVPEGDTLAIAPADLLDNDIDKAGGGLTIVEVGDAVNGTASLDGARVTYTHDGSETTTGSFEYTANNGQDTDSATVRVAVTPVNDPPVGVADTATVDEGEEVSIEATALLDNDTDQEEDPLTITSVGNAVNGGVALVGEAVSYRHGGSETTTGGFTYTVSDGSNSSDAAVTVAVTPVNDPPVALGEGVTVDEGRTLQIEAWRLLANDTDGEDDALQVVRVGEAANVAVSLEAAVIVYRHGGSETTSDSFQYTVSDGKDSGVGTVTVAVTPRADLLWWLLLGLPLGIGLLGAALWLAFRAGRTRQA